MWSLASEVLAQIGPRLGLRIHLEPTYRYVGQIVAPDGRKFYFRNTNFDLNPQGAAETARDKAYAAYFLRQMGYPVPEGETFFSERWCRVVGSDRNIDAAYAYARGLGFPVIVKPNSKSHGSGVAKVWNRRELYAAIRAVFRISEDRVALVQRFVEGDDIRIVVLDADVIVAYRRVPLSVVGDGQSSIGELLETKIAHFASEGWPLLLEAHDYRVRLRLGRHGLSLETRPAKDERITLLDNANLSSGGEAVDVTDALHPGYRELAVSVTRDMGLRYCGVDVISRSPINRPPEQYVVVELNPAPGLDHFARGGERNRQVVEAMYERILLSMIGR